MSKFDRFMDWLEDFTERYIISINIVVIVGYFFLSGCIAYITYVYFQKWWEGSPADNFIWFFAITYFIVIMIKILTLAISGINGILHLRCEIRQLQRRKVENDQMGLSDKIGD